MYPTRLQVTTLCLCWLHVTSIFIPAGTYVFPREQLVPEYLCQHQDTFTPDFVMSALRALIQNNVKRKRVSFYPGLEPGDTPLFEQEAPKASWVEKKTKKKDKRKKASWVEKLRPLAAQGLEAIKDLAIQTTCSGSEAPLVATWTGLFPIRSI